MHRPLILIALLTLSGLTAGCQDDPSGTAPPPDGWANSAPTVVDQVIQREGTQLLLVRQGELQVWVSVPDVGAAPGDHVLLGRGTARTDVEIPELKRRAREVVDIEHVRVVDEETARAAVISQAPPGAVPVGTVYAELTRRDGQELVVYGTAVKVTGAVGSNWVHIQDGTGDADVGTHDITIKTQQAVAVGQRVAFRGTLRKDADIGFGYHFDALVEDAELVDE